MNREMHKSPFTVGRVVPLPGGGRTFAPDSGYSPFTYAPGTHDAFQVMRQHVEHLEKQVALLAARLDALEALAQREKENRR